MVLAPRAGDPLLGDAHRLWDTFTMNDSKKKQRKTTM